MTTGTAHTTVRRARVLPATLSMAALLFALALSGCGLEGYVGPAKLPYAKLAIPYSSTQLGRSTSLEVLNIARNPDYQFDPEKVEQALLTQGDTAISFSGRSEDTRITWLNLIAFDEFRMTARRKYFFCIDEQAERAPDSKRMLFPPRKGLLFDAEFVIDTDVLTTPYATAEAQRIAILQWLAGGLQRDVTTLVGNPEDPAQGTEAILLSAMLINQVFQAVLVELDRSPGLAANLGGPRGINFPHMSLGEGRIRLIAQNELGAVKVRVNLPMTTKEHGRPAREYHGHLAHE